MGTTSTIKVSYSEAITFLQNAKAYTQHFPAETKLKYALDKAIARMKDVPTSWNEKREDISINNAATDADGCVLFTINKDTGNRDYKFKPEGLKKCDIEINAAFKEAEQVEVEPYIASSLPKDLPESFKEVFNRFVLEVKAKELKVVE